MTTTLMKTEGVNWREEMVENDLWDYPLKYVPVPPVMQMVEEIEFLRTALTAEAEHTKRMKECIEWVLRDAAYKAPEQAATWWANRARPMLQGAIAPKGET